MESLAVFQYSVASKIQKRMCGLMKILVMRGSPNRKGSSNLLADEFIRGAKEAGHYIDLFDTASANLHPCNGCNVCGMSEPCCQKDDGGIMREKILMTDMIVFATPLYYFDFSAQLKTAIDRFYSFNGKLMRKRLKAALLVAAWNDDTWTMDSKYIYNIFPPLSK